MEDLTETELWILEQKFKLWGIWAKELGAKVEPEISYPNPFSRNSWHGSVISLDDDTDADDVPENSLYKVLVAGSTPAATRQQRAEHVEREAFWDGESSGIALLKDGRWVGWFCGWGPTGDGFNADAYGGGATIYVSSSPEIIRQRAITSEGRMLCGISYPEELP